MHVTSHLRAGGILNRQTSMTVISIASCMIVLKFILRIVLSFSALFVLLFCAFVLSKIHYYFQNGEINFVGKILLQRSIHEYVPNTSKVTFFFFNQGEMTYPHHFHMFLKKKKSYKFGKYTFLVLGDHLLFLFV